MAVNKERMNNQNSKILLGCKFGIHTETLVRIKITSVTLIGIYRCKNCGREECRLMRVVSDEGNVN